MSSHGGISLSVGSCLSAFGGIYFFPTQKPRREKLTITYCLSGAAVYGSMAALVGG